MEPHLADVLWIVIAGFIIAFILSFAVGANDVANSFATSVGSGVLTFKQACILATIFEIAGAVLLGQKVAGTIRKDILDVKLYENNPEQLMYGMLSALIGCAIWLLIATWLKFPVSTTHSIVGATVGFGLVTHGTKGLQYYTLLKIISSWIISPLFSGVISVLIFMFIDILILKAKNPLKAGLTSLPFIYGTIAFFNVLIVTLSGPKVLKMDNLPLGIALTITTTVAVIVGIVTHFFITPWQKRRINDSPVTVERPSTGLSSLSVTTINTISTVSLNEPVIKQSIQDNEESEEQVNELFSFLQILAAVFSSFAHGGNDVSNAIGPLIAIWLIYTEGKSDTQADSPILILLFGGVGIVFGLWVLGKRVIETIGTNLTKITTATGFVIENGAALTVLLASKLSVPISTTHCKVGSVVFVGWTYNRSKTEKAVDWTLFRGIVYAWIITLPAAAGASALCMWIFTLFY